MFRTNLLSEEEVECPGDILYNDNLRKKGRVHRRRKQKYGCNGPNCEIKKSHWPNRTGRFKDEEVRKGPKYYRTKPLVLVYRSIKTHKDLLNAMTRVASGETDHNHYRNISGINRNKLRLTQSLRDKGKSIDINRIIKMNVDKVESELGFGRVRYGIIYRK